MRFPPRGNVRCQTISPICNIAVFIFAALSATQWGRAEVIISSGWQLQDVAQIHDEGAAISKVGYSPSNWNKATVPGTVLTSLVNDGIYPEPLYGENNRPERIPESLCRTSYWYRTEVTIPSDYAGQHIWLNFHGINYTAEVWVNGTSVGAIRGAFARGCFEITSLVTPGQSAAVAVLIHPPPHPGNPQEQTVALGTGPNGGVLVGDGPTFSCSIGWDWIPAIRDRNIGIWQKVTLTSSGDVLVQDPLINSDLSLPRLDSADLTLKVGLRNVSNSPQAGVLKGKIGDEITFQTDVALQAGELKEVNLSPTTTPQLHIDHPRVWWPNGYGQPNLYALHLSFEMKGTVSDTQNINFGIRKITYEVADSPNITFTVNGVPVMCLGGDWGMDEAMKRIPRQRLEAQVRYHALAHFNMIRNWVGQSTSEDFYDMCDKYGLMIWDEFFQANRSDGPIPNDIDIYLANVREKVLRYRNHPSIALWCGRNESDPAPVAVAEGLQKIMAELDPQRKYHANSGEGGGVRSGGPYSWRTPREFYSAPSGRGRGSANANSTAVNLEPFKTEIGMVAFPTVEFVRAMMPQKDWNTMNDDWAEHDLCSGAQQRPGPPYPEVIAKRYGKLANLPDLTRKAQMANYESFRAMYEGRLAHMFKPCTGVLTWMSNPSQPSFVWQIYSWDLEPLSTLYASQKACEPVHIQMNQDNFHVMVINRTATPLSKLQTRVRVLDLDGVVKYDNTSTVDAAASTATEVVPIEWPENLSPVHFIKLDLHDAADKPISDNFYWRAQDDQPNDFSSMESMSVVKLDGSIRRHESDGQLLLDVTLSNPTKNIAVMAHLQLRKSSNQQRVLPVYYSENYVSLLPSESRTIRIEASAASLGNDKPLILLDGWNVTIDQQTTADADLALNADAQIASEPANGFTIVPQSAARGSNPSVPKPAPATAPPGN